ncbi:MAG: PASTA domain-containing protein [Clostridia bacterium]|nr:PASTA domain-containing protein [Clostridia bacterium]
MKYRFRISERQTHTNLPQVAHRRYRLKGKTTVRLSHEEAERIRLSLLFELGELPEGSPQKKKKRAKKIKKVKEKKPRTVRERKHRARNAITALFAIGAGLWKRFQARATTSTAALPIFAGALCAALLVSALSSGAVLFHLFGRYHASYTSWRVPNFLEKEPSTVLSEERDQHGDELPWDLVIQYASHDEIPAGQVISQSPAAGVTRRIYRKNESCTLTLTVSRGRPTYELSNLVGKSERDARLILQNHGIEADLQEVDTKDVPKGAVLATIPAAGALLHEGDRVVLQISRGEEERNLSVPNLVGLSEERAATLLRAKGFSVGSISYQSSSRPAGVVIAQTPAAWSERPEGSSVSYTVSIGESIFLRTVPELLGLSYADAVARLREYGLVVGKLTSIESAAPRGTVIEQTPAAGTPITSSTVSVDLYLSN